MFAVIKTGGKQYRVSPGDTLTVEKLSGEDGSPIEFGEVLMLGGDQTTVGTPLVEGASVKAEIVRQTRGPKVYTFKKRRRKHGSKRIRGHRQDLTMVRVTEILASGAKAAAKSGSKRKTAQSAETAAAAKTRGDETGEAAGAAE